MQFFVCFDHERVQLDDERVEFDDERVQFDAVLRFTFAKKRSTVAYHSWWFRVVAR